MGKANTPEVCVPQISLPIHIQACPDPSFQGNPRDSAALLLASPIQPSQKEGSRAKRAEEEGAKHLPTFEMWWQVWRGWLYQACWSKGIWSQISINKMGILGRTEKLQRQSRGTVEICQEAAPTCGADYFLVGLPGLNLDLVGVLPSSQWPLSSCRVLTNQLIS